MYKSIFICKFLYITVVCDIPAEVRCEPCMKSWIQNGSSCYLFGTNTNTWLSWTASQSYCAENGGHLVVIDTLEEQVSLKSIYSSIHCLYHLSVRVR